MEFLTFIHSLPFIAKKQGKNSHFLMEFLTFFIYCSHIYAPKGEYVFFSWLHIGRPGDELFFNSGCTFSFTSVSSYPKSGTSHFFLEGCWSLKYKLETKNRDVPQYQFWSFFQHCSKIDKTRSSKGLLHEENLMFFLILSKWGRGEFVARIFCHRFISEFLVIKKILFPPKCR